MWVVSIMVAIPVHGLARVERHDPLRARCCPRVRDSVIVTSAWRAPACNRRGVLGGCRPCLCGSDGKCFSIPGVFLDDSAMSCRIPRVSIATESDVQVVAPP